MNTVISFISQTGNVGKSILASSLAIEAVKNKLSVAVADLDHENKSIIDLVNDRARFGIQPNFTVYPVNTVNQALTCFKNERLQIIDCPSRATTATIEIAKHSDLVVQPATGSKKDLDKAITIFNLLGDNNIPIDKMLLVLNRIGTESEYRKALEYIGQVKIQDQLIAIVSSFLYDKQTYRNAINDSYSITETIVPSLNEAAKSVLHQILSATLK